MVHHKHLIPAINLKLPLDEQRIILDVIFHHISSLHSDQQFKTIGSVCFTVKPVYYILALHGAKPADQLGTFM